MRTTMLDLTTVLPDDIIEKGFRLHGEGSLNILSHRGSVILSASEGRKSVLFYIRLCKQYLKRQTISLLVNENISARSRSSKLGK